MDRSHIGKYKRFTDDELSKIAHTSTNETEVSLAIEVLNRRNSDYRGAGGGGKIPYLTSYVMRIQELEDELKKLRARLGITD